MRTSDARVSWPEPLRVAVNAYFGRHPLTGSGQYLAHLLEAFPTVAPECAPLPYEPTARGGAARATLPFGATGSRRSALAKLCFEQIGLPRAAGCVADVLHYPYWAAPLYSALPTVVTVHDLIPLLLEPYRGSPLARAYTALVTAAARRATMLIVDSAASRRDVLAHFRVPAGRVRVIHLAAGKRFQPADDAGKAVAVRQKYHLDAPFVFYVGGVDRRKNVPRLIAAFAEARSSLPRVHLLAIAGDVGRRGALFADLPAVARALGVGDLVRFLGVVPDDDLPALYQAAAAFAFPSSYEGFGLPPLEALACAAPVLCSSASSLPEVVGDAALILDPDDEQAWAAALVRVLGDEGLRAQLCRRGPRQAARFTWKRVAEETAAVYHEAAERWQASRGAHSARSHAFQSPGCRGLSEEG